MIRWVLLANFILLSAQAKVYLSAPPESCDAFRTKSFQDEHYETRIRNCESLIKSGRIENAQALNYTLKFLSQNYQGLKDSHCALDGLKKDVACRICKDPGQIKKGIKNSCSFILNDLKKPWGDGTTRTTGYYVDLCQNSNEAVVQKFYINRGTGTTGNKDFKDFSDIEGANSTLPGAFLTDDKILPFFPYKGEKYQTLKHDLGGVIPSIRLVGLNASNNSSEDSKPMHVSPLRTSWGCPSVGPQSAPIMEKLVQKGPALIMNYHSQQYEQKESCDNDGSDSGKSHEGGKPNDSESSGGMQ